MYLKLKTSTGERKIICFTVPSCRSLCNNDLLPLTAAACTNDGGIPRKKELIYTYT